MELNEMNIIAVVPRNTVCIRCEAKALGENDQMVSCSALWETGDIRKGMQDLRDNADREYFEYVHPELADEDGDMQPVIITVPDTAISLSMELSVMNKDELTHDAIRMKLAEITQARAEFLTYVGDDYDAVYTLTDEARAALEAMER